MVVAKFIGIFTAFYIFVVLEALEQNFYTARYGKRDDNESRRENFLLGKKLENSDGQEAIAERKVRFFLAGGRFGKRGCSSENCFKGSKEIFIDDIPSRQDRSETIRVPIRKNQFLMGSRFGKRTEKYEVVDSKSGENLNCIYTGISDFYRCLRPEKIDDDDLIPSNSDTDIFP